MNTPAPSNVVAIRALSEAGHSIELFSGCGGLAMGLARAGFKHELLVERDRHAFLTFEHNKSRKVKHVQHWDLRSDDVRSIDWTLFEGELDLVAGGPPCQPFSIGGKSAGNEDQRDMWPEAVRAVRETLPKTFLFENVRGLLRPNFAGYVEWIKACLAQPTSPRKEGETHEAHLARLTRTAAKALYHVKVVPVNAANYGAPQKRERVLFLGFRKDIFESAPDFPAPTHSRERLIWEKWHTGEYWDRHSLARPPKSALPPQDEKLLGRLTADMFGPVGAAWVTCRDAFSGLGEPGIRHDISNHKSQPGARSYAGHTGSPIDEPAKALKAGVHGVPGGENMLLRDDATVRYFSVREAARLQGFPDDFEFPGSWSESLRQLGNAVPIHLSEFVGGWLSAQVAASVRSKKIA